MSKIKVVQYGTWEYCHSDHIMSTIRSMPNLYEIVGVCEPNEQRRKRAMNTECYKELNWLTEEEILKNKTLDAVIIETDELEQDSAALKFTKYGFNVHLEKPGGATENFEKAVKNAQKNGTVFHMGYMYRYNPAVKKSIELVRSGVLGEINYVEAHMSIKYSNDMLNMLGSLPSGMMYYLGCHLTDLMYKIMGNPKRVIPYNFSTGSENSSCTDTGFVLYEYKRGYSFIKTSAAEVNGDARRQRRIQGGAVGAAACRMRVPPKARSRRREPQPVLLFSSAARESTVAPQLTISMGDDCVELFVLCPSLMGHAGVRTVPYTSLTTAPISLRMHSARGAISGGSWAGPGLMQT